MTNTTNPDPQLVQVAEQETAVVAGVVAVAELPGFFDRSFSVLPAVLAEQDVAIAGPAFARYHSPPGEHADLEVGFPTAGRVRADGDVQPGSLPAGTVARLVHHGSFDGLGSAWERLHRWIGEEGLTPGDALWEVYVTEPSPDMDPAELHTELNWVVA